VAIPYGRLERKEGIVDIVNIYFTLGDVGVGSEVVLNRIPGSHAALPSQGYHAGTAPLSMPKILPNQQPTTNISIIDMNIAVVQWIPRQIQFYAQKGLLQFISNFR
jgi:hypothetical protein